MNNLFLYVYTTEKPVYRWRKPESSVYLYSRDPDYKVEAWKCCSWAATGVPAETSLSIFKTESSYTREQIENELRLYHDIVEFYNTREELMAAHVELFL